MIAGRYWYLASRLSFSNAAISSSACAGPETIDTATVRFNATTGEGHTDSSSSYRVTICGQSVWSYDGASA